MSQLEHLLQQCTVKLTLPGQSGWGTGFFVAPGLILTCAHVVRKATDLQVTVFYSARQDPLSSIVKAKADDGKTLDLALVELSEPLFDHPCVFLDEEPVAIGQALYSYGYLKSYTNAAPVRPVNEGLTGNTPPLLKLQGAQIENGISGAALLNLKTGKICGMVKETRAAGFDLGGGAIPTRVVLEQFPQLRELQREFHQQDQQWTNLLKPTETLSPSSRSVTVEDDANSPIVTGDSNLVSSSNVVQQGKYNINASTMSGIHIGDVIHPSHPQTDRKQTIKKILMLSANPENPEVSRRRKEIKEIRGALGRAKHKNLFDLQDRSDIGAAELSEELLTIEPFVVDISGQESGIESLVLENIFNDATSKSSERLIARLFEFHNENIKCIILNKCYSEKQAKAIVQHIEFVVGISQSLKDNDTLDFLKTFYVHLGSERTVEDSYEAGRLSLEKKGVDNAHLPILLKKRDELKRRDLEEELEACNLEIEEKPNHATLWKKKADILKDLNRPEEMTKAYEKASSLDPENYKIRTREGDALEQLGKHKEAVSAYDKALELKEKDYKIWWKKGKALANSKEYNRAKEAYDNALVLKPPSPDNYIICREYGSILDKLGLYQKSIALYRESLGLEPKYRASSYERRQVYKKMYSSRG